MLSDRCLSVPSLCNVGVLWPNSWTDQDETWQASKPRLWPHCVRWGPSSPSPKEHSPRFSAHTWHFDPSSQMAGWIEMPLGSNVGHDRSDIVLDGEPAPPPKKGAQPPPIFGPCLLWPNNWMNQDATLYEYRPRPRPHCATWRISFHPQWGTPPIFYCSQTAGWIKMSLYTEIGLGPSHIVLDGTQLPQKGPQPTNFWPISIVAKRSPKHF